MFCRSAKKRILPALLLNAIVSLFVLLQFATPALAGPAPLTTPSSLRKAASPAGNESSAPTADPDLTGTAGTNVRIFLPYIPGQWTVHFPINLTPLPQILSTEPATKVVDQSPNLNLSWQTQANGIPISHYRVYLEADDETPDTLLAETQAMFLDPPTLALDSEYFWQVEIVDEDGHETAGPVRTFRTEASFDPSKLGTMVTIPAGEFLMGCDESDARRPFVCYDSGKPLHPVYLDTYAIDKYEVTNRQYQACVEAGACNPPRLNRSHTRDWYFTNPAFDHYPILYVSWWDANDYCEWVEKRLPTEAEWEKAARGTIDTRAWPWGYERIDCARANFTDDADANNRHRCLGDTMPVGSHPAGASPYGVMDMSGNVFEWVADVWKSDYYHRTPYDNPAGPEANTEVGASTLFVVRGGSYRPRWFYPQTYHRKAGHHGDAPAFRNDQVGFRCAKSVSR